MNAKMGDNTNITRIRQRLLNWFAHNRRDLPWRRTDDPYHIWVAEVMLQQTQVATAIPYYEKFLERYPDLQALAGSDIQAVLKAWEGLGYYARARHLHRAAAIVVQRYGGCVPATWDQLRQLPGIGDYIAAAVLSIAFNRPHAAVDGNVKRVLARLLLLEDPVNSASAHRVFRGHAERLLDPDHPGLFNQALMELGATVCRPRHPDCNSCPLQGQCRALSSDRVHALPHRIARAPVPRHRIAVGVVFKNDRVLITRRRPEGLLGGLWEFPGGKIRPGETPAAACIREIKEEVNLAVTVEAFLTRVKHAYSHFKIVMDIYCCRYASGRIRLNGPVDFRWARPRQLDEYAFPAANHKFMPRLKQYGHNARRCRRFKKAAAGGGKHP